MLFRKGPSAAENAGAWHFAGNMAIRQSGNGLFAVFAEQVVDGLDQKRLDPAMIDGQQFKLPVRFGAERGSRLLLPGPRGSIETLLRLLLG
jgi:hypothetical protein